MSGIYSCLGYCTQTWVIFTPVIEYGLLMTDTSFYSICVVIVDSTFYSIFLVEPTRLFLQCFIVGRYKKCICCTVGKSILRLNHVSLVSYEKRVRLELRQEFWIKLNTGLTRALILLLLYITSPPLWLKGNMQFNDILYCW